MRPGRPTAELGVTGSEREALAWIPTSSFRMTLLAKRMLTQFINDVA
jgi:hypothetical protein